MKRAISALFMLMGLVLLALPMGARDAKAAEVSVSDTAAFMEAISSAGEEPLTIVIAADIGLSSEISLPDGADITLTNAEGVTPILTSTPNSRAWISVPSGSSLTIDGELTFQGPSGGSSSHTAFVLTYGTLRLIEGTFADAYVSRGSFGSGTAAIQARGPDATFIMEGGSIINTTVRSAFSGAVQLMDGAQATMTGGIISDTTTSNQSAGSVVVYGGTFTMQDGLITNGSSSGLNSSGGVNVEAVIADATAENHMISEFIMNGGTISDSSSQRGAGVRVSGGSISYEDFYSKSNFTMNGGSITGCNAFGPRDGDGGGGGVYVTYGGTFTMNDGSIVGNSADGMGGGVATFDVFSAYFGTVPYEDAGDAHFNEIYYRDWPEFFPARFDMNGGLISENIARRVNDGFEQGSGGGIYIASAINTITGGSITDNVSDTLGGGIYVATIPYSIDIRNSVVTDNTASTMGGGLWACPTGEVHLNVNQGTAVHGNSATDSGDDLSIVRSPDSENATATVSDRILGGGLALWYRDGASQDIDNDWGVPDPSVPRYSGTDEGILVTGITDSTERYELKSLADDTSITRADHASEVIISGNSSRRGGGIGTNGKVTFGIPGSISATALKVWDAPESTIRPESVSIRLVLDGQELDRVELDHDNRWTHTFLDLPEDSDITIREEVPAGWEVTYSMDGADVAHPVITISNKLIEPEPETTDITVVKEWEGEALESVMVDLLADGTVVDTITLNEENQWTHTFNGLLELDPQTGDAIVYTVSERPLTGYTTTITELTTAKGFLITNTLVPPSEDPTPPAPPVDEPTPPAPPVDEPTPPAPPVDEPTPPAPPVDEPTAPAPPAPQDPVKPAPDTTVIPRTGDDMNFAPKVFGLIAIGVILAASGVILLRRKQ